MTDILVANQPWYFYSDEEEKWQFGVRGGSRWPHTLDRPGGYKPFPFYLSYTDAYLNDLPNINSEFLDAITKRWSYTQFYNVVDFINPEYVLLETSTPSINNDLEIAEKLYNKGYKIILGGTHATVFAEKLIENDFVFAIVKGEMEKPTAKVLRTGEPGIYDYDIIEDLDELPHPTRQSDIWLYQERTHGYIPRQINLMTSRGCPFNCGFCQWPTVYNNKNFRQRSVESVRDEIEQLVERYGNDIFIYFDDDTFNIGDERVKRIADILDENNLDWSAMCRVDTLEKETWKYAAERGLKAVNLGIESASQKVLDTIGKNLDISEVEKTLNYMNELGIYIHLTFTHGVPGETEEDFEKTQKFYNRVDVQSKQESRMIAMPGTDFYEDMTEEERRKLNYDGLKGINKRLADSYSKDYFDEFDNS